MSSPVRTLADWIASVTSLKVIVQNDEDPSAPRPSIDPAVSSYAAIRLDSDSSQNATEYERTTDEDDTAVRKHRSQLRQGTLAVEIYGPGAEDYARAVDMSRGAMSTIALLAAAGDISLGRQGEASNDPVLRSAEREPDVSFTVDLTWVESTSAVTDYAEVVESATTVEEQS